MASYDRQKELKAFDETKAGVKGLVDAGVTEVPQFFHHPQDAIDVRQPNCAAGAEIPVIDLGIINGATMGWEKVVELVRMASERFGFFQVLNHGIPLAVLDEMLEGVRRFNEQELEAKMPYYLRDLNRAVYFNSNFDLYQSPVANWRDTLFCTIKPEAAARPEEMPEVCRDIIVEYGRHIQRLGHLLFELISEGLGLETQYLNDLECGKGLSHLSHYYPPCPQPELVVGTSRHSDPDFLTVLLQDNIGGLQVLYEHQWIDVPPIHGALVINIGDLLQCQRKKAMASYDMQKELKAFDETKAGVKGLVDAGVTEVPLFFHHPPDAIDVSQPTSAAGAEIPVINLGIINGDTTGREKVVELVRMAAERFGFFQVLNHGIPLAVLDEMLDGVRRFNEQELEAKMPYYSRDLNRAVYFNCNFDLFQSPVANWRDTLICTIKPEPAARPEEMPEVCRDIIVEYGRHVQRLGHHLFELISEGLGLETQYLNDLECGKGLSHLSHYYPPCTQPELVVGTSKHADPDFLTVLLQDNIGGLQVLYEHQWIDVPPIYGALVINIGDLLQLISNDKFKSVEHRVRTSKIGPRVSVACFFSTHFCPSERSYGPIKELLSQENCPKYKEVTASEYRHVYRSKGLDGKSALDKFRL